MIEVERIEFEAPLALERIVADGQIAPLFPWFWSTAPGRVGVFRSIWTLLVEFRSVPSP
jgi:hypothetical protein